MEQIKSRTDYSQALMSFDGVLIMEGVTKTCPNCKAMKGPIEKMMKKYPDTRWYQYDADEAEDVAQELGARQVPTFTVFKDGMLQDGVTGAKPVELENMIKESYEGNVVD